MDACPSSSNPTHAAQVEFTNARGFSFCIKVTEDTLDPFAFTVNIEPLFDQQALNGDTLGHTVAQAHDSDHRQSLDALTPREKEVAHLVFCGCTNAQIADQLYISLSTVKSHIQNIFEKLQVSNRVSLAALMMDA